MATICRSPIPRTVAALLCSTFAWSLSACQSPAKETNPRSAPAVADGDCAIGLNMAPDAPVATVSGKPVTCKELAEHTNGSVQGARAEFEERVHQIHQSGLESLIDERLMTAKAEAEGKTVEEWVKAAIDVPQPTDEEIQAVYDRAKASGQELPPLDELRDQVVAYLTEQPRKKKFEELIGSLRKEAGVETKLPPFVPPKVDVAYDGPAKGPAKAPVTIVEFSDFECPFCGRAVPTLEKVMAEYGDKVRLIYADFPLPNHSRAPKASEAAHCANDQGKYWEMHDKLFANQRALEVEQLKKYAGELGLDQAKFDTCLDSGDKAKVIAEASELGRKLGVSGTPAFFINGRMLSGAQPFERFKELIDYELAAGGSAPPTAEAKN